VPETKWKSEALEPEEKATFVRTIPESRWQYAGPVPIRLRGKWRVYHFERD
jgi:hypothetical protein